MPWHFAQAPSNVSWPSCLFAPACEARNGWYSVRVTTLTKPSMCACSIAAELGAAHLVAPVFSALNHVWLVTAGDRVDLAAERGHPPAVDHVVGDDVDSTTRSTGTTMCAPRPARRDRGTASSTVGPPP